MDETKNISCAYCKEKYEIKIDSEKFKTWIREDIPLSTLFPKMSLNTQLLLTKGICLSCTGGIPENFKGTLDDG